MHVARGEHPLPLRGIGSACALDPPVGVLMMRDGVGRQPCIEHRSGAQESAQQGVHIPLRAHAPKRSAGPRRLIYHGSRRSAPIQGRRTRTTARPRPADRSAGRARERRNDGPRAAVAAQGAVAQVGQRATPDDVASVPTSATRCSSADRLRPAATRATSAAAEARASASGAKADAGLHREAAQEISRA
jgi:hypothetical protein